MNHDSSADRDLRTLSFDNVKESFRSKAVEVWVPARLTEDKKNAVLLSVNLLARWCRDIIITGADPMFYQQLRSLVEGIYPESSVTDSAKGADIRLIFEATGPLKKPFVHIDYTAWTAVCGFNQTVQVSVDKKKNDNLFFGWAFAAVTGNAELFRFCNDITTAPYCKYYSLWDTEVYASCPEEPQISITGIDLGRIDIVGCGAIGSSFAYLFPYSGLKASMRLIDPQTVNDLHNTSSSLLFMYADYAQKRAKSVICSEYLIHKGLSVLPPEQGWYNIADAKRPDIIFCFANEHNIWTNIQSDLPPLTFHATTSKSWGFNVGRHMPLMDECIACTFKDVLQVAVTTCSTGDVKTAGGTHTAVLPFLSAGAAVLALCEGVKAALGKQDPEGSRIFNMGSAEGCFLNDITAFGKCVYCKDQTPIYESLLSQMKYKPQPVN